MSILASIFKPKAQNPSMGQEPLYQDQFYDDPMMDGGGRYSGGQGLPPVMQPVLPPTLEKEVMDLYLKVKTPKTPEKLKGIKRYWVFTDDETATEVPTSNLDARGQRDILSDLQIAIDFDGCDNCDKLRQDKMLMIHAKVITDKARSDYPDRLRERVVPSVGLSLFGQHGGSPQNQAAEKPKENRSVFGVLGGGR